MGIEIKQLETEEEIRGKAYVHWRCWHEAYPGLVSAAFLDALTLEKCETMAFRWTDGILIAKDGGRVIGFVGFGDRGEEAPGIGEIFALYILPEYYGSGLGRRLMEAGLARLTGYPRVCLWVLKENRRAIRFYEKCGFVPDGGTLHSKNIDADEIRMSLDQEALRFRGYREEDFGAVCEFLTALNRDDRRHINWNWARFEWMAEHPYFDRSKASAIGLWLSGDRVVGAAIYDLYFGEASCLLLPAWSGRFGELLDYAWQALRDETGLGVALCDQSGGEIAAALARGFAPTEQTETVLQLELDRLPDAPLPEGYRLEELDPGEDLLEFQWLLWRGFDHGEDRAAFEQSPDSAPVSRARPHFRRALSMAAVGPDGDRAAYCCLWYLDGTDYAYVEPVCTVPSRRGMGLASAALVEAMKRARALGAKTAYVISDAGFYRKLGFETAYRYRFYRKEA